MQFKVKLRGKRRTSCTILSFTCGPCELQVAHGSPLFAGCSEYTAALYDLPSTLSPHGPRIGTAARFGDVTAVTPGAAYDHESFLPSTVALAPAHGMPKALRNSSPDAGFETPGPPAYLVKKDAAHYRYSARGGYSIAANLRTDFTRCGPGNDSPGPGAHGGHRDFSTPDACARPALPACQRRASCVHGSVSCDQSRFLAVRMGQTRDHSCATPPAHSRSTASPLRACTAVSCCIRSTQVVRGRPR